MFGEYASVENLVKDVYLRRNMSAQGFVLLSFIASFNRIRTLTTEVQTIRDALRDSKAVEIVGGQIRRREDWAPWVFPDAPEAHVEEPSPLPVTSTSADEVPAVVVSESTTVSSEPKTDDKKNAEGEWKEVLPRSRRASEMKDD